MRHLSESSRLRRLFALLLVFGLALWTNTVSAADGGAVGFEGPGGGEFAPDTPEDEEQVLDDNFGFTPMTGKVGQEAVFASGCIAPFRAIRYNGIILPRGGSFLHRVVPDRRGFNVVMTINYPGLNRRVNRFGPGRTEAFTVRTPFNTVVGSVTISGVRGSFGCYRFSVTP